MEEKINTVTISLEKYEKMKAEIEKLRKENQEKTIVKIETKYKTTEENKLIGFSNLVLFIFLIMLFLIDIFK